MKRTISGHSLVGTLAAAAIIAFAFVVYFKDPFGWMGNKGNPEGQVGTLVGDALDSAHSVECREHLNQVRLSITNIRANSGEFPAGIQETSLNGNFYNCPVGGQDYQYDAETGTVTCVNPGHEKY